MSQEAAAGIGDNSDVLNQGAQNRLKTIIQRI